MLLPGIQALQRNVHRYDSHQLLEDMLRQLLSFEHPEKWKLTDWQYIKFLIYPISILCRVKLGSGVSGRCSFTEGTLTTLLLEPFVLHAECRLGQKSILDGWSVN